MRPELLLNALSASIAVISFKLKEDEKSQLVDLLSKLSSGQNMDDALKALVDFCQSNSSLEEIVSTSLKAKVVTTRGKPNPKPMTHESGQVRLLASRLISALESK